MGNKAKNVLAEYLPLEPFGVNENGETFELINSAGDKFMVAYRKAGSISGRHWHEGREARKNPERLIFLKGRAKLLAKHMETAEELEVDIEAPCQLLVYPKVYHELKARTDIVFLELNSLLEHQEDTLYH